MPWVQSAGRHDVILLALSELILLLLSRSLRGSVHAQCGCCSLFGVALLAGSCARCRWGHWGCDRVDFADVLESPSGPGIASRWSVPGSNSFLFRITQISMREDKSVRRKVTQQAMCCICMSQGPFVGGDAKFRVRRFRIPSTIKLLLQVRGGRLSSDGVIIINSHRLLVRYGRLRGSNANVRSHVDKENVLFPSFLLSFSSDTKHTLWWFALLVVRLLCRLEKHEDVSRCSTTEMHIHTPTPSTIPN